MMSQTNKETPRRSTPVSSPSPVAIATTMSNHDESLQRINEHDDDHHATNEQLQLQQQGGSNNSSTKQQQQHLHRFGGLLHTTTRRYPNQHYGSFKLTSNNNNNNNTNYSFRKQRRRASFDNSFLPTTTHHYYNTTNNNNHIRSRRHSLSSSTSTNCDSTQYSIDIMDFGVSQRQLSVYNNGSSVRRMRMENNSSNGENGREWSELCDSHGFLGWDPLPPRQEGNVVDDEDDGDGSTVKERGSTPNNNNNSNSTNNNNNNSSSRGLSRGLSNRTILIDGRYIMCSERSLSVNSVCSGVTITDDAAAEEQQDLNEEGEEEEERMMVKLLLPKSSSFRNNRCQSSWRSGGELVVEVSERLLNHDTNTSSGTTTDDDDGGIEEVTTRAMVLGATNDEHDSHTSSSSSVEEEAAATAASSSSSTRRQRKEWLGSRKESIRTLDLSENAIVEVWDTVMDETTTKSSSSSSLLSSSRRDDHLRRGAYTREESIRTLGDESVYSVDSKGFMAWNKMDHHHRRCRGKGGIDACNNSSREEEEELMDPSSQQRRRRGGGKEEESLRAETCGVDGKEEEGEMDDGGLLVDWEDQSNKKNSKLSLNDDSCNNDGESNESDGKNEGDDVVKLDATSSSSSSFLNETSEMSNTYNETSDFCPTQIKLHPSELGKRLSRRMRLIVADKLSSSVPSQPSSASTRLEGEESQKNLASSLPLASDLSDSVPPIETNIDDHRHRGFGTSREESTRTFDSWAQTVNSADDKNGGGLLVDWDLTMTKKINQLSLNESSNQLIAADGRGAQEEDEEADDDTTNNGDNDMDAAAAFLTEIIETLDEWQTNRSSIPPDFRPAQITLDGGVENTLSNRMRRMSKRLTSSLPGHTTTTSSSSASSSRRTSSGESSWNLVASSLTSELRSGRGSLASSWTGLSSSDDGFPKKTGSRSTTTTAAAAVPALSSSSLREGDANRPIRIGREDNVNIEELRRELLLRAANDGDNEGSNKPRRKSSLLGFI